jgi:hypothetical protein
MSLGDRLRIEIDVDPPGKQVLLPIQDGPSARVVAVTAYPSPNGSAAAVTFSQLAFIATIVILITGFIGVRRPSLATAAHRIHALDYAETSADIDDALAADAPDILELSTAALFTFDGERFALQRSSNWHSGTASIPTNDLLVRTLRSEERVIYLDDAGIKIDGTPANAHPSLVVPIIAHDDMRGFVLYGNHRDGSSLDPDEIALIERLVRGAGNAYLAVEYGLLRVRSLDVALS